MSEPAKEYQAHYEKAWLLLRKILSEGNQFDVSRQGAASEAVAHFAACLRIVPKAWPCMWGLGKVEQALGNHEVSLAWFEKAGGEEPGNPDVWREASIEALAIGSVESALDYAERARRISPNDPGLLANLALALLVAKRDSEAQDAAERASSANPQDALSRNVLRLVAEVREGRTKRPRKIPISGLSM